MDGPRSPTPEEMTPRPGAFFLLVPVIAIFIVFLLYAYLFASGMTGRPATGLSVEITFETCPEAEEAVRARVEEMGLGEPVFGADAAGFTLTAVLPDTPDAVEQIPPTLSTTGLFEVRAGDEVLVNSADVLSAGVRLDMTMAPTTLIVLTLDGAKVVAKHMNADPEGTLSFFIDGVEVYSQSNHTPFDEAELEIPPSADGDQARMALAAHRGIIVGNPLPCGAQIASVHTSEAPE